MIQGVQRPHGPWTLFAFLHETPNSVGQSNNNQNRLYVFHFIIYKSKGIERKNPIPCLFFYWAITNSQIYSWACSNLFCRSLQDKIRFDAASTGLGGIHHWDEFCCYFSIYEDAVRK